MSGKVKNQAWNKASTEGFFALASTLDFINRLSTSASARPVSLSIWSSTLARHSTASSLRNEPRQLRLALTKNVLSLKRAEVLPSPRMASGFSGLARSCESLSSVSSFSVRLFINVPGVFSSTSAEKCLMQTAIHGDDLAGGLAQALRDQQKIRFRLVHRHDGRFGQRAVSIELCELLHERFSRLVVGISNVIFCERANDTVTREHRRALYDRRRRDAVDAHERRKFDGQFAHEMIARRLGNVIRNRTFLGHRRIRRSGEHQLAFKALLFPCLESLVTDEVAAGDIDVEHEGPFVEFVLGQACNGHN